MACNYCNSYLTYLPDELIDAVIIWRIYSEIIAFVPLSGCTWSPRVFLPSMEILVIYDLSIRGHCSSSFSSFFCGKTLVLLVAIQSAW